MQNFTEYTWDRSVNAFVEACQKRGIDHEQALYNELWGAVKNFFGGNQNQQQDPQQALQQQRSMGIDQRANDQGQQIPSSKGARKNAGYADVIAQGIQAGIPQMMRNIYSSFRQQYPNLDDSKVKSFFNSVSKKLTAAADEMMSNVHTNYNGQQINVHDTNARRRV